jgi:DNA-3-methyladenine glycosylase
VPRQARGLQRPQTYHARESVLLQSCQVNGPPLTRDFFMRDALVVARALIGCRVQRGRAWGRIVETEAYRGPTDLACHARVGLTKRTRTLFGPPGHVYVFLIYGMYDCTNIVCRAPGSGHAVLLRGVEPIDGLPDEARGDGPGKLSRMLGIGRDLDGADVCDARAPLRLFPRVARPRIATTARVGVGYAGVWATKPWRFFDPTSDHVSRPSAKLIGLGAPR